MKTINVITILAMSVALLFCQSYADTINIELTFSSDDVVLSTDMDYDTVEYPNTIQMDDLGKPTLPVDKIFVSLPFDSTVSSVSVVSSTTAEISGDYLILPAQVPIETGDYTTISEFVLPDPSVYNEDEFYPENPYSDAHVCNFMGGTMGFFEVYPIRYNAVDRELEIFTSITLRLTYTPPSPPPTAERYMEDRNRDLIIENLESLVENPDDVEDNYEPVTTYSFSESNPSGYSLDAPSMLDVTSKPTDMTFPYTYVIITNDRYCGNSTTSETDGIPSECSPLKEWRTELGVPSTIRTVQWIAQEYWTSPTEEDLQAAIRAFLTDAEQYWGTIWFILVGDVNTSKYYARIPNYLYSIGYSAIVPARFLLSEDDDPDFQYYSPCDLYYMNLTDDFLQDKDDFYGEYYGDIHNDSPPDFTYAIDLFGGRVPADTETEVEVFIGKLLDYEKCNFVFPNPPNPTYLSSCLQVVADFALNQLNKLDEYYLSPVFDVKNMFETKRGSEDPDAIKRYPDFPEPWEVVEEIQDYPAGIINIGTHGHPYGYYILTNDKNGPYIQFLAIDQDHVSQYNHGWVFDATLSDIDLSDNTYSFLYSHACQIQRYDDHLETNVGEEFLFNPTWGGTICVGNIRDGYDVPSFRIMEDFYGFLMNQTSTYSDDHCYAGEVQCETLQKNWSGSSIYLNMTYVNQLFGCPRTPIWRGDPQTIDTPSTDFTGGVLTVTVEDGGDAVEGAIVCLWMKNDLVKKYFLDETNGDGEVMFNIGQGGCNNAILTVTYDQQNYLPYQDDSFSTD